MDTPVRFSNVALKLQGVAANGLDVAGFLNVGGQDPKI